MNINLIDSIKLIKDKVNFNGDIAVILGSGLGGFSKNLSSQYSIPFSQIPNYPISNVKGHDGEFIFGKISGKEILVAKGRAHLYEGYSKKTVSSQVKIFKNLGIKNLIITNSAGSLRKKNPPGTFMIINGHIDMTFQNSSNIPEVVFNPKFYCPKLISIANQVSVEERIRLESGIYCWTLGPSYETAEEIKFFRALNGSAVGMSTVPEIEMGGKLGLRMLTISTLTNYAAGISKNFLSHNEVLKNAEKSKRNFFKLLKNIIKRI